MSTCRAPASVVGALVVSGLPTDRFCVEGFLPRKGAERRRRSAPSWPTRAPTVVLEAPGRRGRHAGGAGGDRRPGVRWRGAELTKLHEEVWRGTLARGGRTFSEREVRGEVVLVLGGAPPAAPPGDGDVEAAVRDALASEPGAGPRQVADRVAASLGVPRRRAYEAALRVRDGPGKGDDAGSGPP